MHQLLIKAPNDRHLSQDPNSTTKVRSRVKVWPQLKDQSTISCGSDVRSYQSPSLLCLSSSSLLLAKLSLAFWAFQPTKANLLQLPSLLEWRSCVFFPPHLWENKIDIFLPHFSDKTIYALFHFPSSQTTFIVLWSVSDLLGSRTRPFSSQFPFHRNLGVAISPNFLVP